VTIDYQQAILVAGDDGWAGKAKEEEIVVELDDGWVGVIAREDGWLRVE